MADCLQKRIGVSQPTYCLDEEGNVIESTVMYNWMHIRSVGPNCLKDTTLCGDTIIHNPCLYKPVLAFGLWYEVYLDPRLNVASTQPVIKESGAGVLDQWYWQADGVNTDPASYDWQLTKSASNDLATYPQLVECYGLQVPLFNYNETNEFFFGLTHVQNTSGKDLLVRCTLDATLNLATGSLCLYNIGLGRNTPQDPPVYTVPSEFPGSVQQVEVNAAQYINVSLQCLTLMEAGDIIAPVWLQLDGDPTNALQWLNCNLHVEFVDVQSNSPQQTLIFPPNPGPP